MYRFVFLFFLVFLFSCERKKKLKDFPEITINKFHDILFSIDSSNVSNKISELHVQDSFFLDFYVNEVLYTDKNLLDTAKSERVQDFLIQYSQNKFRGKFMIVYVKFLEILIRCKKTLINFLLTIDLYCQNRIYKLENHYMLH